MIGRMTTAIAKRAHTGFENAALALIAAKRSPHTRAAYRRDLRRWLEFCDAERIDPVSPPLDATSLFRDHLTASLSNESARRVIAAMSAVSPPPTGACSAGSAASKAGEVSCR